MKIDRIARDEVFSINTKIDKQDANLKSICQEFESVFISYLLKSMRKTIPNSDDSGNGFSREVYTSMMDEEVARTIAKGSGIGLAKILYSKFTHNKNF